MVEHFAKLDKVQEEKLSKLATRLTKTSARVDYADQHISKLQKLFKNVAELDSDIKENASKSDKDNRELIRKLTKVELEVDQAMKTLDFKFDAI